MRLFLAAAASPGSMPRPVAHGTRFGSTSCGTVTGDLWLEDEDDDNEMKGEGYGR
jgi:hypothetical protein